MPVDFGKAMMIGYQIPGMQWPKEMTWIYEAFAKSGTHIEVGAYCGKSLWMAASGNAKHSPASFIAVDDFSIAQECPGWVRKVFAATAEMIAFQTGHRVQMIEKHSFDAAKELAREGVKADSAFIDGCHHYAECRADIEAYSSLVKPGGILAGHDYWPEDTGVMDAVNDTGDFETIPGTRVWLRKMA